MKFIFLMMFLLASPVFAIELNFSFDINSSGPSIYPCDAGIKHQNHESSICYDRSTQNLCDPNLCSSGESCNCVCSGNYSNGDNNYAQDFFDVSFADWVDNGLPAPNIQSSTVSASKDDFQRLFSGREEWRYQLKNLTFNFGSERYGTEFYLDVCYRGSQIDFEEDSSSSKHHINLQATINDLETTNGLRYSQLSDLHVRAEATCDLKGSGSQSEGPTDDPLNHQINGVSGGDVNWSTDYASFNAGGNIVLVNDWISKKAKNAPRFCKIRYYFLENIRNKNSDLLSQMRKWQLQQSRVSTFSRIQTKNED